ncbi:GNAT family N-acetyltransferase [Paenibacillus tarimensis]|uniref:GNAT family N-acetyltransferase n=1 Tax=Paenibacillus tarimensis TaxID=416012 RepID=UPI001F348A5E|nr:GNAT family N-acetyltransferase [Paenibacillus tarimensis]MCF2946043.1 acetyltransferase [Paenibacillus tarimensis]
MILFQSHRLIVRKLEVLDADLLVRWLTNPEVLQYYEGRDRPHNHAMVRESFLADDGEMRCIVEYEEAPIGYIQYYELDQESRREYGYEGVSGKIYGMDQFIGEPDYWNKGIGKQLVTNMIRYLIDEENADKIVMDPQTWNTRALACYAQCGFVKVKLLPAHELHEGQLRDCWLLEYPKACYN